MPFRMQNRPSILGRLGGYLLLVGLLGFGCWTMGWHLGEIRDHRASVSWKETQAEILSAQVHFGSKGSVCTCIRYRYQAGSEILEGKKVRFGAGDQSHEAAEQTVARFPVGKTVPAYFDPQLPQHVVLDRTALLWQTWLGVVFGAFLIALPVLLLFWWRRIGDL